MKYLLSLLLGVVTGVALFLVLLYFNPFAGRTEISPCFTRTTASRWLRRIRRRSRKSGSRPCVTAGSWSSS
jgi:hypothetical protein